MNEEFRAMLSELNTVQQAIIWWAVFWRWLFRPRREWIVNESYAVLIVIGQA